MLVPTNLKEGHFQLFFRNTLVQIYMLQASILLDKTMDVKCNIFFNFSKRIMKKHLYIWKLS